MLFGLVCPNVFGTEWYWHTNTKKTTYMYNQRYTEPTFKTNWENLMERTFISTHWVKTIKLYKKINHLNKPLPKDDNCTFHYDFHEEQPPNYLTLLLKSKQLQIRMDWSIEFFFYNFSYGGHLGPIGCELDWGPSPPRTIPVKLGSNCRRSFL